MTDTKPMPPPALGICRQKRVTNRRIARELGVSEGWACRVLLGYVKPPTSFRQGLAALLEEPEELLFPAS
jgi:transcriptional regulator with XRE-family HTH domain